MCDCPAETLASLILAAVRTRPGLGAGTVRGIFGHEKVCLIHYCGALHALARKDLIRSGDPHVPIRAGMTPDDLSDVPLHAGRGPRPPSLEHRLEVLGELLEDPPGHARAPGNVRVLDGRFKVFLDEVLGRGGTGTVYRGEQISLGRRVAVKIVSLDRLHPSVSRAAYIERLEREPRVLGKLNHPHIVQVIDGGREGERLWHAMEYLEGGTLASRVEREGPLPAPIILDYMLSLAEALGAAATHGIQHRDVKPENIFNAGMKLADFGLAKVIHPEEAAERSELTRPGCLMGTLPYIAPERANLETGDERADIYSLGATMYYAATGRYLFKKQDPERIEWLHLHLNEDPVPIDIRIPGFPLELGKVIHKCLAKRAADRDPSIESLAGSLRKLMPVLLRPRTRVSPPREAGPKRPDMELEAACAPKADGGPAASMSVILSNMDLEVLNLFGAYEERFGAGCWAINPSFLRVLWRLAEKQGLLGLCARMGGVTQSDFATRLETYLSSVENGEGGAPQVSADIRDYVWQALRQAAEQNGSGFVADTDPAEALIGFLRTVRDDDSFAPYRLPEITPLSRLKAHSLEGRSLGHKPERPPSREERPRGQTVLSSAPGEHVAFCEEPKPVGQMGPYRLEELIGQGGMAMVYRALDTRIGRIVALKVLHTIDPAMVARFRREAQIAGGLDHPSIAVVYDVGENKERCYIAMRLIEGKAIDVLPRPTCRTLELVRETALALQYAHEQGVIHRDVKPGNILVDKNDRVYLTDFGVAKQIRGEDSRALSVTGTIIGTPEYMSPEQARGDGKKVDGRSDIYSLGATLYALLARRPPFSHPNVGDLLFEVVKKRPPPLRELNPRLSPELERVVARAMSKEPDQRYPSPKAFAEELGRLIQGRLYEGRHGLAKALARRWLPMLAAGVMLGLGVRWGAPMLVRPARRGPVDSIDTLYRSAASALRGIEDHFDGLPQDQRRFRIEREVVRKIGRILETQPQHIQARVLLGRAAWVAGQEKEAATTLATLRPEPGCDYRVPFLQAMIAIEASLSEPPALPTPGVPWPAWEGVPEVWPPDLEDLLRKALDVGGGDPMLTDDFQRDAPVAKAMLLLINSRWPEAAEALSDVLVRHRLEVYKRGWCRAAYRARRFQDVRNSPLSEGLRERIGAGLVLALESNAPCVALEQLRSECASDPGAALLLDAVASRQAIRLGDSPERYVLSALDSPLSTGKWAAMIRGVALATRLAYRSWSEEDAEDDYRKALDLLGEDPPSALAKWARIELLLGLGRRLSRLCQDAKPVFEDALKEASLLSEQAPGWTVPRVLRGEAQAGLGQLEDGWAEMVGAVSDSLPDLRALLASSSLWMSIARRQKRAKQSPADPAKRAREWAVRALASAREHPEGLTLYSQSSLLLAEEAVGQGVDESLLLADVVQAQERALKKAPDYVEARVVLAGGLILRGEALRRGAKDPLPDYEAACRHLDRVLEALPGHAHARYLRGLARHLAGDQVRAAEDWRQLVARGGVWDTPELRNWIERAESSESQQ